MKKIAVIGANSYIARNLIYVLRHRMPECELVLYDIAEKHADNEVHYKCVNIFDVDSLRQIDLDCETIYMFVGKTGSTNGFEHPEDFIKINELSLINLLNEYRRQHSAAKIIFPSTRLVYKGSEQLLKENAEKDFKSVYAVSKHACERYLELYRQVFEIRYCIFRICLPYGTIIPGVSSYGTADFMISQAKNNKNIVLYGTGEARRTLTYIEDLCNVLIDGAFSPKCENDIFNIGGEDFSLREMAELISKKYKANVKCVPWPDMAYKIESGNTVFDDSKLRNAISCTYKMSFEEWIQM